jgi:nicotinate-nucleotide adenylyltransferase
VAPCFSIVSLPDTDFFNGRRYKLKKIGIFGGTFDPVHIAHLRVAEEFTEALGLDRVLMTVSAVPPHRESPEATASQRLEMLGLAAADNPAFEVSDIEISRKGPSYTLDTVREVRSRYDGSMPYLALGVDAYLEIAAWHRPADVLAESHIVVLTRPGFEVDLISPLSDGYAAPYRLGADYHVHESGATLRMIRVSSMDVSSSGIRSLIAQGRSIRYLVPHSVLKYIRLNHIYGHWDYSEKG